MTTPTIPREALRTLELIERGPEIRAAEELVA